MTPELAAKFLEHGITGACVIALAYVVWKLYKAYNKIQDDRVLEAKAVTDKMLSISEEWLTALGDITNMVERHSDNVTELRNECRERTEGVATLIREMIRDLRTYTDEQRRKRDSESPRPGGR